MLKKGDEVVVLAGAKRASAARSSPSVRRSSAVIVEGVQMIKRHTRKSQEHPQGAIVEREGTIHISNVMKAERFDARARSAAEAGPGELK